jgi:hypothetical protein
MKRHEWWRLEYKKDPYLEILDQAKLAERTDDVTSNGWEITDQLKLGVLPVDKGGEFWMISWTHLLEESGTRGGLPSGPRKNIINLDWPGLSSAVPLIASSRARHADVLVKYGQRDHMEAALQTGRIRIAPASSYSDPSLNQAIRDNELELPVYRRSKLYNMLVNEHGYSLTPSGPKHGYRVEVLKAPSNYYVYCLGMERSLRMFGDFEAQAALVIHEPKKFIRRLAEGVSRHLGPTWTWFSSPISYVDPLRPPGSSLSLLHAKHFKFAYQKEFRVIWLPGMPATLLDPFFVEIGSLTDCAEVLELRP